MLASTNLDPRGVVGSWKPYRALDPPIVLARARTYLSAPESVALRLDQGALIAAGTAPARWIEDSRRLSRTIPDVAGYDDRGVADTDRAGLERSGKALGVAPDLFARGSSELATAESDRIREAVARDRGTRFCGVRRSRAGPGRGRRARRQRRNQRHQPVAFPQARRESPRRPERQAGRSGPSAVAVGSSQPLVEEKTEQDRQVNRSVSFRVVLAERARRKGLDDSEEDLHARRLRRRQDEPRLALRQEHLLGQVPQQRRRQGWTRSSSCSETSSSEPSSGTSTGRTSSRRSARHTCEGLPATYSSRTAPAAKRWTRRWPSRAAPRRRSERSPSS